MDVVFFKRLGYIHYHLPILGGREPHVVGTGDPGFLLVGANGYILCVFVALFRGENLDVCGLVMRLGIPDLDADKD